MRPTTHCMTRKHTLSGAFDTREHTITHSQRTESECHQQPHAVPATARRGRPVTVLPASDLPASIRHIHSSAAPAGRNATRAAADPLPALQLPLQLAGRAAALVCRSFLQPPGNRRQQHLQVTLAMSLAQFEWPPTNHALQCRRSCAAPDVVVALEPLRRSAASDTCRLALGDRGVSRSLAPH